ncbi:hypothetical protein niasHT_003653 [Heterodera trifolii]|uniref:Uncharacterized protein n=1 Tax=Heterodera trifolii TaxID=157864 RepID=A0ABD2MF34_9BILA
MTCNEDVKIKTKTDICAYIRCTTAESDDLLEVWTCLQTVTLDYCNTDKKFAEDLAKNEKTAKVEYPWANCKCEGGEKFQDFGVTPPMSLLMTTTQLNENTTENATVATDASGHHQQTALAFILPLFVIGILPNLAMPFAANR